MENKITLSEYSSTELEVQILKSDKKEILTLLNEAVLDSNISGADMVNILIKLWIKIPWIVEDFMNTDFWGLNPEILLNDGNWNRRHIEWTLDKKKIAEAIAKAIENSDSQENQNLLLWEKNKSKSSILESLKERMWIVVSIAIMSAAFWSYFTNLMNNTENFNSKNPDDNRTEKVISKKTNSETKIVWNGVVKKIKSKVVVKQEVPVKEENLSNNNNNDNNLNTVLNNIILREKEVKTVENNNTTQEEIKIIENNNTIEKEVVVKTKILNKIHKVIENINWDVDLHQSDSINLDIYNDNYKLIKKTLRKLYSTKNIKKLDKNNSVDSKWFDERFADVYTRVFNRIDKYDDNYIKSLKNKIKHKDVSRNKDYMEILVDLFWWKTLEEALKNHHTFIVWINNNRHANLWIWIPWPSFLTKVRVLTWLDQ